MRSELWGQNLSRLIRREALGRFLVLAALGGLLAFGLSRVLPAYFTSRSVLLLSGSSGVGQISALARVADVFSPSALGPIGEQDNGYTYIGILKSDATIRAILESRRPSPNEGSRYFDVFAPKSGTEGRRWELAVENLREQIKPTFSTKDFLLIISFAHTDPNIANEVTRMLVGQLQDFNASVRVSRARESAKFIEARLSESADSLRRVEDRLVWFRETNARFGHSPALIQRLARLERDLRLSEETFILLAKQLEVARVEEKREVPIFTVIDQSRMAAKPMRIPAIVSFLLGSLFTMLPLIMVSLWQDGWRSKA